MLRSALLDSPRRLDGWEFLCLPCDNRFLFGEENSVCPACGNLDFEDVVPVHVEEDPRSSEHWSKLDFGEGD